MITHILSAYVVVAYNKDGKEVTRSVEVTKQDALILGRLVRQSRLDLLVKIESAEVAPGKEFCPECGEALFLNGSGDTWCDSKGCSFVSYSDEIETERGQA